MTSLANHPPGKVANECEVTRFGRNAGICASGVLALLALIPFSIERGSDILLSLLFWSTPVALVAGIAGVLLGVRSMVVKERLRVNRVGARLSVGLALVLAAILLLAVLLRTALHG